MVHEWCGTSVMEALTLNLLLQNTHSFVCLHQNKPKQLFFLKNGNLSLSQLYFCNKYNMFEELTLQRWGVFPSWAGQSCGKALTAKLIQHKKTIEASKAGNLQRLAIVPFTWKPLITGIRCLLVYVCECDLVTAAICNYCKKIQHLSDLCQV